MKYKTRVSIAILFIVLIFSIILYSERYMEKEVWTFTIEGANQEDFRWNDIPFYVEMGETKIRDFDDILCWKEK